MTAWLLWAACAPDLRPDAGDTADTGGSLVQTSHDGVTAVVLDATSETAWVPYDFDAAGVVDPGHLQVQRYRLRLGDGVEAAWLDVAFDDVVTPPADGWTVDADPIEADEDYALNAWYIYDEATHTLSPTAQTLVLRSADGLSVKLGFDGYYDEFGTPGFVAFHWSPLERSTP